MRHTEREASKRRFFPIGTAFPSECAGNMLCFDDASGELSRLEIAGRTEVDTSLIYVDGYYEYFRDSSNYVDAGVTGFRAIPLPEDWLGKRLVFSLSEHDDGTHQVMLSDGRQMLFSSTTSLLDSSGTAYTVESDAYTHLIIGGIMSNDERESAINSFSLYVVAEELIEGSSYKKYNSGDDGVKITLRGSNLLDVNALKEYLSCTIDNDIVTLKKESASRRFSASTSLSNIKEGSVIRLSINIIENTSTHDRVLLIFYKASGGILYYNIKSTLSIVVPEGGFSSFSFYIHGDEENGAYVKFNNASLEVDTSLGYEKYIEKQEILLPKAYVDQNGEELSFLFGEENGMKDTLVVDFKRKTAFYKEKNGKVHPLEKTELGKSLLLLKANKAQASVIDVDSSLDMSYIRARYYSYTKDNKLTLSVLYQDTAGNELKKEGAYEVREGSIFSIIPPYIDGYLPQKSRYDGKIIDTSTVKIIYEAKK